MANRAFNGRRRFTQDDQPLGKFSRGFPQEIFFQKEGLVRGRFPILHLHNGPTEQSLLLHAHGRVPCFCAYCHSAACFSHSHFYCFLFVLYNLLSLLLVFSVFSVFTIGFGAAVVERSHYGLLQNNWLISCHFLRIVMEMIWISWPVETAEIAGAMALGLDRHG